VKHISFSASLFERIDVSKSIADNCFKKKAGKSNWPESAKRIELFLVRTALIYLTGAAANIFQHS